MPKLFFSKHYLPVLEEWTKSTKAGFAVRALEKTDTVSNQREGLLQLSVKNLSDIFWKIFYIVVYILSFSLLGMTYTENKGSIREFWKYLKTSH